MNRLTVTLKVVYEDDVDMEVQEQHVERSILRMIGGGGITGDEEIVNYELDLKVTPVDDPNQGYS